MLLTHFSWQTDLKPLSGTNAKNGAITISLILTMHISHARCDEASEWVGGARMYSDVSDGLGWGEEAQNMCTHAVVVLWLWH